jgi:hypothetical protein
MDIVDKSGKTRPADELRQRQISPYLRRPLRSLEEALADLREEAAEEHLSDLLWEQMLRLR